MATPPALKFGTGSAPSSAVCFTTSYGARSSLAAAKSSSSRMPASRRMPDCTDAHVAHRLDDVAGAGLALGPDHRRALADAAQRLAEVAAAAHERHLELVLVDVVLLVGRGQHLGLVDVVDLERLEHLGLGEVADAALGHDRDADRLLDLADQLRVAHARHAAELADVRRHALEGHDRDGARLLGDPRVVGGHDVHDHAAREHAGEPDLGGPGGSFDGGHISLAFYSRPRSAPSIGRPGAGSADPRRRWYDPPQEAYERMINAPVLVLNQNYEPLNVCDIRRAFRLLGAAKAELLANNHQVIHTPTIEIPAPSVIRLQYHVKRPQPRVRLSRREVFSRDRHTCQYCGKVSRDLTIDHVTPKHRGGRHEWENLVAACRPCNHRKGGKTVAEARMRLLREPRAPRADLRYLFGTYLADERNDAWRTYLFLEPIASSRRAAEHGDRCRPGA